MSVCADKQTSTFIDKIFLPSILVLFFLVLVIPNSFAEQQTQTIHSEGQEIKVGLEGLGSVCPTAINITSVADLSPSNQYITTGLSTSIAGCSFMTWVFDDSLPDSKSKLFPVGLNNSITSMSVINTIDVESDTNYQTNCQIFGVSDVGVDPRNNITAAYEAVQNRTSFMGGTYSTCNSANAQVPTIAGSNLGSWYDTLTANSTFFSYGINLQTDDSRFQNRRVRNSETVLVMNYINPTLSTAWQIQEHSKFPSLNMATGKGQDLDGNFNLDVGSNGGQMVIFKEFDKSEVGSNDIQVTGNFLATGIDTTDVRVRFEIKDGGYAMQDRDFFPKNEHEIYQNGGSLGVVHLIPDLVDVVQPFDISMIPNYANSTEDIFTVFIGVEDNSSSNSISANITNFEIDSQVRHDFTSLDYVKFWELTLPGVSIQNAFPALAAEFDAGIVNITSIGTVGVTGNALPVPSDPTDLMANLADFDTVGLSWNHDLLNATGIRIERDSGSGFDTIAILSSALLTSFEDSNQPNRTKADVNSLEDAIGLEPDTTYTYRITLLNGESESNSLTSAAFTTPADLVPFWELHEHSAERPFIDPCTATTCVPIFNVETNGGTGDWLSLKDEQTAQFEGRQSFFLMKSFNITEYGIDERTEAEYYFDSDCTTGTTCVTPTLSFADAEYNRFSSELFPNVAGVHPVNQTLSRTTASPGSTTGSNSLFEPHLVRATPDITEFDSGFMTVFFTWDSSLTGNFDIKNFTLTNSTTWDFTNTVLNYTSDPTNCNLGTAGELTLVLNSATECDSGSVFAKPDTHLQTTNHNGTSDWEFREHKDNAATNALGLWTFESNSTGFTISALEQTDIGFTNEQPREVGEAYMFKTFTPLLPVTNFTITHEAEGSIADTISFLVIEQFTPDTLARYNGTLFESTLALVTDTIDSTGTIPPAFNEITTTLMADTSAHVGTPVTALIFITDPNSFSNSKHQIKEIELNNIGYNFSNAVVTLESNAQDGKRGLVSATVIVPPSPTPETIPDVDAAARLSDVFLNWTSTANTTDYFIDRNGTEIVSSLLVANGNITTTAYLDTLVPIGDSFIYSVTPFNEVIGFTRTDGNTTDSNLVKTNDTPAVVQNVFASTLDFNSTSNLIIITWDNVTDTGNGSPLDIGVPLTKYQVFSKDVTLGNPYILAGEVFATSPPDTFFNDPGVTFPNDYLYKLSSCNILGCSSNSTEASADSPDLPDAVTTLVNTTTTAFSVNLFWQQPNLNGGTLSGYNLNFTLPFGEPKTVLVDDTDSTATAFLVSGLMDLTNYSFRVSAVTNIGLNTSGTILNVTTLDDFIEENYTIGTIMIPVDNPEITDILFERTDIDETTIMLNVTYPFYYDLSCDFYFKFGQNNIKFANLTNVQISGTQLESSFVFNDIDNEIVDVICTDANTNATGDYIITQTQFELLNLVQGFRSGEFGTEGNFGILDITTLAIIILSMIGFNRVNETMGVFLTIAIIGSLAYFEFIELPVVILSAMALVIMLVVSTTRKE